MSTITLHRPYRFQDIPPYTRFGSYEVDIPLQYLEDRVRRDIAEVGLDIDPDFQRAHVWTRDKQIAFMEYLLRGGHSSRVLYFNCGGWMDTFKGPYVLVDGKQRLEAARAFLRNDIPAFGIYCRDFTDDLTLGVTLRWHVNDLKTRREVLQWYLDLNAGGVVHTQEELDKVRELLAKE
jgi:hypothetical protein